jgi:hypothetical protein
MLFLFPSVIGAEIQAYFLFIYWRWNSSVLVLLPSVICVDIQAYCCFVAQLFNKLNINSFLNSVTNVSSICPILDIFCGWQTYHLHVLTVYKSGILNFFEPESLSRPVQGLIYLDIFSTDILHTRMRSFLVVRTSKIIVSW